MDKLRRLLLCFLAAGVFLAPLALHASVGEPKRQHRLPLAPIVSQPLDAGEIAHCDARPWLNDAPTCLRPATRTEPPRLVRVVTVERLVGASTSVLERTTVEQTVAR
jgi:hypothetical protein